MRPPCTRDRNSRLTVRASPEWLRWAAGLAHHLGVDRAVLVTKAVEEFAEVRQYDRLPPQRYIRAKFWDPVTAAWTDEPPGIDRYLAAKAGQVEALAKLVQLRPEEVSCDQPVDPLGEPD